MLTYIYRFCASQPDGVLFASNAGTPVVRKAFKLAMSELFADSQINREPRWPILSKLTGASLVLHAALLASLVYVPGLRDAFNIAALLANTRYSDRDYSKTEVGEDVQMLTLAGDKFRYPPGYFATEEQLRALATPTPAVPQMTFTPNRITTNTGPTPTPEPSPSLSPRRRLPPQLMRRWLLIPKPENRRPRKRLSRSSTRLPLRTMLSDQTRTISTHDPLKDWLARANALRDKGQLDLSSEVEITIAANLNTDCKLDDANVIQKTGDARLIDVAKDMVSAIGDSGMLSFLRDPRKVADPTKLSCDAMPLQVTIKLDQNDIAAKVETAGRYAGAGSADG